MQQVESPDPAPPPQAGEGSAPPGPRFARPEDKLRARVGAVLSALPEWDLSDLYPGRDSPALTQDLGRLAADAEAFRRRYEGRLAELTGAELGAAVAAYERLQETSARITSFASLTHAGDLADPEIGRFFQTMQE